jgi:small ligand-binding sensory domain FIST
MQVVRNEFSVAAHWAGGFDEAGLQSWAEELRRQLAGPRVSLGLVFMTPRFYPHAAATLELLRVHGRVPLLAGCSSGSLIAGAEEVEEHAGLVLGLYHLPGATVRGCHFVQSQVEEVSGPGYWSRETDVTREDANGWLAFLDPFHLDVESWMRTWNEAYAPEPVVGGLASGELTDQRTQLYLNGEVFEEGGVAIALGGEVSLTGVISQGCTPIGETWTITRAERNFIQEIGNRPAYEVLAETYNSLPPAEQKRARGNLFVGLAVNEYRDEFRRGDFLIRNLLGADPRSGILAVGAFPRRGQTLQFQRRDAAAGTEDITGLLRQARAHLAGRPIYGACLCSCNGRGHRLFGEPGHDARHVQQEFGPVGLAGFFCNGEIGPVGDRNYLHGYTASVGLFHRK